jgi:hypothetical protein
LDNSILFAPTDLDINITPQSVTAALSKEQYGLALNMALHLLENNVLCEVMNKIPYDSIDLVVKSVDGTKIKDLLIFISEQTVIVTLLLCFYLEVTYL